MNQKGVWTPYAGAVLDLTHALSAYVSYASIFEPHTEEDVTGRHLDPLDGTTYELGLKAELLDRRLFASAAVFRMQQENYAGADGAGIYAPDGSVAYHPVSGLKSKGFELEISGVLLPGWRLAGGFANARSRDREGLPQLTDIPENSFKLFTTYALHGALEGLTVGGSLRWQSKAVAGGTGPGGEVYSQGSLALADVLGSWRIARHTTVSAHINNLFDHTYYASLYSSSSRYGEPRSFSVILRADL